MWVDPIRSSVDLRRTRLDLHSDTVKEGDINDVLSSVLRCLSLYHSVQNDSDTVAQGGHKHFSMAQKCQIM